MMRAAINPSQPSVKEKNQENYELLDKEHAEKVEIITISISTFLEENEKYLRDAMTW